MYHNSGNSFSNSDILLANSNQIKVTLYNKVQYFYCHLCNYRFLNKNDLEVHLNEHIANSPFSCPTCGFVFYTKHDLMHHACNLQEINTPELNTSPLLLLEAPEEDVVSHTSYEGSFLTACDSEDEEPSFSDVSFENIPQIDGINDLTLSSIASSRKIDTRDNVKIAPYCLDRTKQVGKLAVDASKEDFQIDVSSNEHNVTILCATGFYSLVAQPAFTHIIPGFSAYLDTMVLTCFDKTYKVDSSNANVNDVFFFRIESHSKTAIGKVTVPLHHTARKVQIQGGSFISDRRRACIWFLENYILSISASLLSKRP